MAIALGAVALSCGRSAPGGPARLRAPEQAAATGSITAPDRPAPATPKSLVPVPLSGLVVESGAIDPLPGSRLGLRRPCIRAVAVAENPTEAELEFVYLGPSEEAVPLASGELRRQIGLKLRARDACNVVYVMWHLAPTAGIHVSVKSNPGSRTHAECRDRGYRNLRPLERRPVPVIRPGQRHLLGARLEGDLLRVTADGVVSWEGRLQPEAIGLDGPAGLRSDNGLFDVQLRVCAE